MSDNNPQYSQDKLKNFKSIIDKEIETIDKELEKLKEDIATQNQKLAHTNVAFNQSSRHFQQQAKVKQTINRLESRSSELHSALERIDNKTYGICERTGELIREERLKAKPTARYDIVQN